MNKVAIPADGRTEANVRATAFSKAENVEFGLKDIPTANPFHNESHAVGHSNVLAQNSPTVPDTLVNGGSLGAKSHKMGQHFATVESTTEAAKTAAYVADKVIDEFPILDQMPSAKAYIVGKTAEAYGFRIGVVESVAVEALEKIGIEVDKNRSMDQIAKDESNHVDIRTTDGREFDVKFENDNENGTPVINVQFDGAKNEYIVEIPE